MGKLFEVLRRLIVASIYVCGVLFSGVLTWLFFQDGATSTDNIPLSVKFPVLLVCALVAMPALHKVVNWILLKDDNKDR